MRRLIVMLLALLVVWPAAAMAQSPDLTLEEYAQLVREAFAAAQRNDEIGLREAATRLTALKSVAAADGSALLVNNQWLADELAKNAPNILAIRERLGAQVEVLTIARTSTPADLAELQTILNAPPFAEQATPEPGSRGSSWSWNFLDFFFGANNFVTGCLTVLAVIAVTGLVGYIIISIRNGLSRDVRRPVASAAEKEERNLSSGKAIQRADEVAVEGDFRKGVRYLYLSTLLWLEERGVLRYDRTLTNREVLEAVPSGSPLRTRLTPVVQTFDRVWYGFAEIDQTAFDAFRQQVTALREGR
ncbi:MAG: DUF4129 domain-containing protein [Herpetosiphonaceae bacterium]|nr:DUF4129 domain-containing protein [Herpetosiphonaceae bacterium]